MAEWLEPQPIGVPEALRRAVGGHPLVAEALVRRGVCDPDAARAWLDPSLYRPRPPDELPGMTAAVERLAQAVRKGERILIWGDFDVDGLASTAILVENLRAAGAVVNYHIPGRSAGHGVHLETVRALLAGANPPQLVVTCDTGVGALAPVAYARGLGVDFVITDHHALPPELPAARAMVNPCFLPEAHPLRTLPGAGCAYLLVEALAAELGTSCVSSLDLLALAIVADVARLQGDVRYYLQRGLATLRAGGRLGLEALYETAGLAREGLDEEHIGFALAPRLNALGRLSDATLGLELLLTTDLTRARTIAAEMEGLNARRQLLTNQVLQAASDQIERDAAARQAPALVVGHPAWPGGIVGLVAGRLVERYGKPAIVFATPPGELARGSARSVPGIDIAAAIAEVGDLVVSHGGHPMAAGVSLRPENLADFRRRVQAAVGRRAAAAPPAAPLAIDGELELAAATPELARDLGRLAPFGPGWPAVCLAARRLVVIAQAAVGRSGEHRRLYLRDGGGREHKVFWWQSADRAVPEGVFDLAFTMRPRNYQGRDEVTLEWVDARAIEAAVPVLVSERPAYQVFDHRDDPAPLLTLDALRAAGPVVVWAEGCDLAGPGVADRLSAAPGETLLLWTAPPGPQELAALLRRVSPQRVHLFALPVGFDEPEAFLRRLAGLVKHALLRYGGLIDGALLERMAAATAGRTGAVRCGLQWLAAQGQWTLIDQGQAGWRVSAAPGVPDPAAAQRAALRLADLLAETAAYRAYVRRADPHILLAGAQPQLG